MHNEIRETDSTNNVGAIKSASEPREASKVQIKRGVVDSLIIYEVSESELKIIERGAPQGIYMNIFLFFVSMSFSFLIVLLTVDFQDKEFIKYIFLFLTICGCITSIVFIILWLANKNEFKTTICTIKNRIKL